MKYVVNIGSWSNNLDDPDFFFGTSFWGEEFSTYEEYVAIRDRVAMHNGEYYNKIQVSFSLASTVHSVINEGNKQAKESLVNLNEVISGFKSDSLAHMTFYWHKKGFNDNGVKCWWMYFIKGDKTPHFIHKSLKNFLREDLKMEI